MSDPALLRAVLDAGKVGRDSLLVVHSAFAGLSRQGFQAEAVIETFLDRVPDGGLFMPTMTWRTVTAEKRDWDEMRTPSHTGVLTEIFRTRYATARSIHPTHSVAGFGRDAQMLLSRHHVDDTPVSENSPYGLMRDYDVHILMLGVGLECCTAIHLPEETIAEDLYVLPPDTGLVYPCRDRSGLVHEVRARRHRRLDRDFTKFATPLAGKGRLRAGWIGDHPWSIVRMADLLREVFAALIDNAEGTLRNG
jgi:aminoglycoside 3-N-acetyltransferase